MNWNPEEYRIFETITGSHLYGTATPTSDTDLRGVCLPPRKVMLDPWQGFEQKDSGFKEEDRTIYALAQFMKLAADANPNIIELLFAPDNCVVYTSHDWRYLMLFREYFLSKKIRFTFAGMTMAHLHRIERHRRWFTNPPAHKPTRDEFGLDDSPWISAGALDAMMLVPEKSLKSEVACIVHQEREYRNAKKEWDNYQQWEQNRNRNRKATEEQFGYDTKDAAHLMRILYEGEQLLRHGTITFPLPIASDLLDIRNGCMTYEQVIALAQNIDQSFDIWTAESDLPHSPNREGLKEVYFSMIGL